ncbi:MAG: AMP-binding protein [Rhodobacteraceae bacterium]|nr:AMP-binding protein [Paracoccaceae bacterium]
MNLAHWLQRTAQIHGDAPALLTGMDVVADYATFHAQSAALAGQLGIKPGDRVGLFMANCPEFLIAFWAVWIAGGAVVPINNKLHGREAAWILENSGAARVFVTSKLGAALGGLTDVPVIDVESPAFAGMLSGSAQAIVHREAADIAWLFYTSGTTGRPKGVRITHGMLEAMTLSYFADVDPVTGHDATLYAAPMSHAAGIYNMLYVLKGARHVCPPSGGFDAGEVLELSARLGSVCMFMAPTMVRRFTDVAKAAGDRAPGIRTIVYAGGPMYTADIIEAVDWFGPKFAQIYGQGECPMAITALSRADVADRSHPRWRDRLGSVGRAQSVVELRIGGEDGQPLPPGETGEIMVRGAPVMPGYWENPEASAKTLVDGWLMTGDVGRLDEDGYLTLTDRSKDVIISGGSNIYPREVEEVLLEHPDVHEVSVVGRPDPEWGEVVVAFVVSVPGKTVPAEVLDAYCTDNIARFKRPKLYRALPELPKNNYGKVLKTALRDMLKEEG